MSYTATYGETAAVAEPSERAAFIRRTYLHLALAIGAFAGIEAVLLSSPLAEAMLQFLAGMPAGWLLILGGFMIVGWIARGIAFKAESLAMQYVALALYVVAEAIIFVPLLYIALNLSHPSLLSNAAILTGALFAGLTMVVFTTRSDFSFLGSFLWIGGFIALGTIVVGVMFGFDLGLWFSAAMIVMAGGSILYDTSNVLHHFPTDRHVGASLMLFASVALLFWYVLRILMIFAREAE